VTQIARQWRPCADIIARLVSPNGHVFKSLLQLADGNRARGTRAFRSADGEIGCLEPDCIPNFNRLLVRQDWPWFYAFDLIEINGRDLRALPLIERKERLREVMPTVECRLLFLDSIVERGCDLYRAACERDLDADPLVAFTQATSLHEALSRRGVQHELVALSGERHVLSVKGKQQGFAAVSAFLAKRGLPSH
jgi:hypothetical protein